MAKELDKPSAAEVTSTPKESPAPPKDVIVVGGPSEDGNGVSILRVRDTRVEAGELRNAAPGKPIVGELVKLSPREESDRLFDVEVLAKSPYEAAGAEGATSSGGARKGPAKVASEAYRTGWEDIFGGKASKPDAGNSDLN